MGQIYVLVAPYICLQNLKLCWMGHDACEWTYIFNQVSLSITKKTLLYSPVLVSIENPNAKTLLIIPVISADLIVSIRYRPPAENL